MFRVVEKIKFTFFYFPSTTGGKAKFRVTLPEKCVKRCQSSQSDRLAPSILHFILCRIFGAFCLPCNIDDNWMIAHRAFPLIPSPLLAAYHRSALTMIDMKQLSIVVNCKNCFVAATTYTTCNWNECNNLNWTHHRHLKFVRCFLHVFSIRFSPFSDLSQAPGAFTAATLYRELDTKVRLLRLMA